MEISAWDERYRLGVSTTAHNAVPTPLLVQVASALKPGSALDLACGAGRNAAWLASKGWRVTAVDGSAAAIEVVRALVSETGLAMNTVVANLELHEFVVEPLKWDLIAMCYYLQRDLLGPAKHGIVPGGLIIAVVHITEAGEEPTAHRLRPGELRGYFEDWEIVHYREGSPKDTEHRRSVAEVVARRPAGL